MLPILAHPHLKTRLLGCLHNAHESTQRALAQTATFTLAFLQMSINDIKCYGEDEEYVTDTVHPGILQADKTYM